MNEEVQEHASSGKTSLLAEQPRKLLYMDNAATSYPKPPQVIEAVREALGQCLSIARSTHVDGFNGNETARRCRGKMAGFLGATEPEEIVYTYSATDGLNTALRGMVKPGSHVIISPLEHHSVMRPLHHMRQESGLRWDSLPADSEGIVDPAAIRALLQPDTSCIVINYISNVSGSIQPVEEIGRIATELGIPYLVDAAQAAGSHRIDAGAIGCQAMAMPAHKALMSLPGMGLLYLRRDLDLPPWRLGGTGYRSELLMQPEERPMRYESGTVNLPGIVALDSAMDWFAAEGIDKVHAHCAALTQMLLAGIAETPGLRLIGPAPGKPRGHVVSFIAEGIDPLVFSQVLAEQHSVSSRAGLHCAPTAHRHFCTYELGGTVRLSPGALNTVEQIEQVLEAVRDVARELL